MPFSPSARIIHCGGFREVWMHHALAEHMAAKLKAGARVYVEAAGERGELRVKSAVSHQALLAASRPDGEVIAVSMSRVTRVRFSEAGALEKAE